jgi:ring-1,2-phenylacetyl-CoA epoxidase subunit PaaE
MTAPPSATPVADRIQRIPDPDEPVPAINWPTAAIFVAGVGLWVGSSALAIGDVWPWPVSTVLNFVALYLLFTALHEASHRTLSTNEALNIWLGRVSMFLLAPHASFQTWRYVHMQHHRFTNDDGADPDYYTSHGRGWTLPLRWATIDLNYLRFYLPVLGKRPRREKVELALTLALLAAVVGVAVYVGWGFWLLVLGLLPSRLAILGLGFGFDWLPHHGLDHGVQQDRYRTTRNFIGLERLAAPLALYQNYHLVHHLHPLIPFNRYIAAWRRNEEAYLENDPALATITGRPLTVEEYRRLRALEH